MKSLFKILKEEFENFFNDEPSLGDRLFNKKHSTEPIKSDSDSASGEYIGSVNKLLDKPISNPVPVYKNPKNLKGFTDDCRGILLANGDLYLAKTYYALHDNILDLLAQKGIIPYASKFDYGDKYPEQFIAVIRAGETNVFNQSIAYDDFPNYYLEIFDMGNKKQPYKFEEFYF